ncbi:KTSC domain-containing protein [Bacillaceae bacterium S4-13-58]
MIWTSFENPEWNIQSFKKFGYDKEKELLMIQFTNGTMIHIQNIEEQIMFEFIISTKKDAFIEEYLMNYYQYHIEDNEASMFNP